MSNGYIYLTYDEALSGTTSIVYSKTEIPKYIAKATPKSPLPNHRFNGGGKSTIKTKSSDKPVFYAAVCQWLKEVKRAKADVEMQPNGGAMSPYPIIVVLHHTDNTLEKCGQTFTLAAADGCAVCPPTAMDFNAKTMTLGVFLESARKYGGLDL